MVEKSGAGHSVGSVQNIYFIPINLFMRPSRLTPILKYGGKNTMTRNVIAALMLSVTAAAVANAQTNAVAQEIGNSPTYAQVRQLIREAQAPEQFRFIATYYSERQMTYLQKAAEEKAEWERRSQNITGILAKYPRPVDSARNLYEYYMLKASETGALRAKYIRLAAPDPPVNAQ
jgi:cobalamin biosynthesis protein CbiD